MQQILKKNDLFIFDLDGVIYEGNVPIQHSIECVNKLIYANKKIAFFTNNSTRTTESYQAKLTKMNLNINISQIYTSALVTAASLKNIYQKKEERSIFIIGEEGLCNALSKAKFSSLNKIYEYDKIIQDKTIKSNLVVAGLDKHITYKKLAAASILISRGAKFYATNTDSSLPDPSGLLPGAGAMVSFLSTSSGKQPEKIFGKPSPEGIFQIMKDFSVEPNKTVIIGDRIFTDILCGKNAKINTALVLTGISKTEDLKSLSRENMPDYIFNNLSELGI